jgi:hypothetical protein
MAYGRFDVERKLIKLTPDQVIEYSSAAAKHYTTDYAYHNWNHALSVASGTEIIAGKLEAKGLVIAKGALAVAAAWHDAGYHEDHTSKGFATKEAYSAASLEEYLSGKTVGEWERSMMLQSITATWAHYPDPRTPYELIMHRADIANIGGPTDEFIDNSLNLWRETQYISGKKISWQKYVDSASNFIQLTYTEHDTESLENFLDPEDTTVDVNDVPFKEQALKNIEALQEWDVQ